MRVRSRLMTAAASAGLVVLLAGCESGVTATEASAPPSTATTPATTPTPDAAPTTLVPSEAEPLPCQQPGDTALTLDGEQTSAIAYGTGPAVILTHQIRESICDVDEYGRSLATAGYRVLVADVNGAHAVPTITAAADWLRSEGATKLGMIGPSMGATYVLVAAPVVQPDITVALSPPTVFNGQDAVVAASEITGPVLLIAGAKDGRFPGDAQTIADASAMVELVIVPDSGAHGHDFLDETSPVRVQIMDALQRALGS